MRYPYSVYQMQVEQHKFWVAKSLQLSGCVGQGDTAEEAVNELSENEAIWLETSKEVGIPIPAVQIEFPQEYSGKMTLRVSPSVHQKAAECAKKEGISLNQYINDAIVSKNSEISTLNYVSSQLMESVMDFAIRMKRAIAGGSTYSANTDFLFSSQLKNTEYKLS